MALTEIEFQPSGEFKRLHPPVEADEEALELYRQESVERLLKAYQNLGKNAREEQVSAIETYFIQQNLRVPAHVLLLHPDEVGSFEKAANSDLSILKKANSAYTPLLDMVFMQDPSKYEDEARADGVTFLLAHEMAHATNQWENMTYTVRESTMSLRGLHVLA
jgi:hypothetical protein